MTDRRGLFPHIKPPRYASASELSLGKYLVKDLQLILPLHIAFTFSIAISLCSFGIDLKINDNVCDFFSSKDRKVGSVSNTVYLRSLDLFYTTWYPRRVLTNLM